MFKRGMKYQNNYYTAHCALRCVPVPYRHCTRCATRENEFSLLYF